MDFTAVRFDRSTDRKTARSLLSTTRRTGGFKGADAPVHCIITFFSNEM